MALALVEWGASVKLIVDPHGDDVALFAAWTALREKPLVVVVFDSYVQPARGIPGTSADARRGETEEACDILDLGCEFLGFRDDDPPEIDAIARALQQFRPTKIWTPAFEEEGHAQHNLVARASGACCVVDRYLTYTRTRGKSTSPRKVAIEDPEWIGLKLRALACFESQFQPAAACVPHFIGRSLEEYYL